MNEREEEKENATLGQNLYQLKVYKKVNANGGFARFFHPELLETRA